MNSALARQAYVTLGNGAVLPHGLVDLELVDAGVRPPPGGVREQSGLTQFSWKVSGLTRAGIRREAMNCRGIGIVDVIKLAVAAEAEGHYLVPGVRDLGVLDHPLAIVPERPDLSGLIITIDVGAAQPGQA